MRDNDPRLTGAAVPLRLVDTDGTQIELNMRPLSDRDMDEIDAWLRAEFMSRVEASVDKLGASMKAASIAQAVSTVPTIHFMDGGAGSRMIASPVGLARLVWQSVKSDHPDLTHGRVRMLISSQANRVKAKAEWESLNLGKGQGKAEDDESAVDRSSAEPRSTADSPPSTDTQ